MGVHLEGPFINEEKMGAHCLESILEHERGIADVEECYGDLSNVAYITLAPEQPRSQEVIKALRERGVLVSLGHTNADLQTAQAALSSGATAVTHLFNAMTSFHHRWVDQPRGTLTER